MHIRVSRNKNLRLSARAQLLTLLPTASEARRAPGGQPGELTSIFTLHSRRAKRQNVRPSRLPAAVRTRVMQRAAMVNRAAARGSARAARPPSNRSNPTIPADIASSPSLALLFTAVVCLLPA
jgi:hypothetical protein